MIQTKLIVIDGIPGSGKSTTGQWLADTLTARGIANRFYHEMEEQHPLRIYDKVIETLETKEEADWFCDRVRQLFTHFVQSRRDREEIAIVESWLFQDTISFGYNTGMDREHLHELADSLRDILAPLDPVLIYFYQLDVERNWRWICDLRGPDFTQGRCGIYTDEDFRKAGEDWSSNQAFIHGIVQSWDIPKLVIRNEEYRWDEYREEIEGFMKLA